MKPPEQNSYKKRAAWLLGALLATCAFSMFILLRPRRTVEDAEAAVAHGQIDVAAAIVSDLLAHEPTPDVHVVAARVATLQGDFEQALGHFRQLTKDASPSADILLQCAQQCGQLGRLGEAERLLRLAIDQQPHHLGVNVYLMDLLRMEGRNWEAQQVLPRLLRQRRVRLEHLQFASNLEGVWLNSETDNDFLTYCADADPDSPLPLLGPMRQRIAMDEELDVARQVLTDATNSMPHLMQAQAALGELLFDSSDDDAFLRWHAELPKGADGHPTIWTIRARWFHRRGDNPAAVRCLSESIRLYPNDRESQLLMAKSLTALGRPQDAAPFQRRGDLLLAFDDLLFRGGISPESVTKMIELLEQLGRPWEALAWCSVLRDIESDSAFAHATEVRLTQLISQGNKAPSSPAKTALKLAFSEYPRKDIPAPQEDKRSAASEARSSTLKFHESSSEVGMAFQYFRDLPRLEENVYTFDFSGGGAGVLDYDGDDWPDLYLTQSCRWPRSNSDDAPRNALFRNVAGASANVTKHARIGDQGFGLGAAVGDFNADGFPDLYVANLGGNVLYVNQGDGTFEEVTGSSGVAGSGFSLSAAFADFSGDGLPDLYVVHYLGGDALTRQCQRAGKRIQCSPLEFPGQEDRLYLNLGSGEFRDITQQAGIALEEGPGKGMGLVVANFDRQNGLDVFVTNDTMANRLYLNQVGDETAFVEQGRSSGVAYDNRGALQGSMGIAAADVDRDGTTDLFVTNYVAESNNLFLQLSHNGLTLFDDTSRSMNLASRSKATVGWGAQFFDADLDGDCDLFVANGHLDQNTAGVAEPKQRPTLFEQRDDGTFQAVPEAADYFQRRFYGRAAARLDWNRDGLMDVCVTHMVANVALLMNQSKRHGHFIAIELHGVECSRDAVGTVIEIEAGKERWVTQATAGDGFSASNQKQILLGLGDHENIDVLTIHWPDGDPQTFENIGCDRHWVLVQGAASLVANESE